MNQNILIHNSGDCEAGGQMKVSGKGLLVPSFHGRKREKSRVIEEKRKRSASTSSLYENHYLQCATHPHKDSVHPFMTAEPNDIMSCQNVHFLTLLQQMSA